MAAQSSLTRVVTQIETSISADPQSGSRQLHAHEIIIREFIMRDLCLWLLLAVFCSFAYSVDIASSQSYRTPISGTYTIAPGGDFQSFTDAINFLNVTVAAQGLGPGGIIFNVAAGNMFYENPPAITLSGSEGIGITFRRHGSGANPKILATGTATGAESVIKLSGVDWYTFDGIDIANAGATSAMEYGFHLAALAGNGCNHNTITNCAVTLSNAASGSRAILSQSISGAPNASNTYTGNFISNTSGGIYIVGVSGSLTSGETIGLNQLASIGSTGIYVLYGTGITVSQNTISTLAGTSDAVNAIQCGLPGGSALISDNHINGFTVNANANGIHITNGSVQVSGNTISGFFCTSGSCNGILVADGNVVISENTVQNLRANRSVAGININANVDAASIAGNQINAVTTTATSGTYTASGMLLGGTQTKAYNNMIWSINSNLPGNTPTLRGITTLEGTAINLWNNTVFLNSTSTAADFSCAALYISSANPTIDLQGNIFVNTSTPGTTSVAKTAALWIAASSFAGLSANTNRNLYYAGTAGPRNLICVCGTSNYSTLQDYKLANPGKDQGSFTEMPPFVSVTDPIDTHIASGLATSVEGNAPPLADVTTDIDGQPRNQTNPDIGADEGSFGITAQMPCTDFEDGWGIWTPVNGTQTNHWVTGSADAFGGSNAAYITAGAESTPGYDPAQNSVVHIYADFTFPTDMEGVRLLFNWKGMGESGADFLSVHIVDPAYLPQAGVVPPNGTIGDNCHSAPDWLPADIALPSSLAGETKRVVFTWRNDNLGGIQPAVAIDNIRVTGSVPPLDEPQISALDTPTGESLHIGWDPVDGARQYRIERSDDPAGTFTTLGWTGNPDYWIPLVSAKMFFRIRAGE